MKKNSFHVIFKFSKSRRPNFKKVSHFKNSGLYFPLLPSHLCTKTKMFIIPKKNWLKKVKIWLRKSITENFEMGWWLKVWIINNSYLHAHPGFFSRIVLLDACRNLNPWFFSPKLHHHSQHLLPLFSNVPNL